MEEVMLHTPAVTQPKKTRKTAAGAKAKTTSKLAEIGNQAMRQALLDALVETNLNLSEVARRFGLTSATNVRQYITSLGLTDAYAALRAANPSKHARKHARKH